MEPCRERAKGVEMVVGVMRGCACVVGVVVVVGECGGGGGRGVCVL